MRGKYPPQKQTALVGIRLGLDDNIIIHSVNNILILLSMINRVNVYFRNVASKDLDFGRIGGSRVVVYAHQV